MRIVLASASPRRRTLLEQLGLTFDVVHPDVDETLLPGEVPETYVLRMAGEKAATIQDPDALVIAADTTVVLDDEILGKPGDAAEAVEMLERLAGQDHTVHTALCVSHEGRSSSDVASATVTLAPLDPPTIERYVATGEPLDKAGAYGLQGIGGQFVTGVVGDPTTVVGLPVSLLRSLLADLDVDLLELAR